MFIGLSLFVPREASFVKREAHADHIAGPYT